jgi:hypothetical protein
MTTSSIASIINQFKNTIDGDFHYNDSGLNLLYNFRIGLGEARNVIYMSAEIRPNCLDTGKNL